MTTAAILLAAGASRRFGADDKLLAKFKGRPLVAHAAEALSASGAELLMAVVTSDAVAEALPGFEIIRPPEPVPEQSDSLRAGIAAAQARGAARALVALGDMPFVDAAAMQAVLARATDSQASALTDGTRRAPPACFPTKDFEALLQIKGDTGAARLIKALPPSALVQVPSTMLIDIDTPQALSDYAQ